MRTLRSILALGAVWGLTACDRAPETAATDLAFLDSLALAVTVDTTQHTVSPLEMGLVETPEESAPPVAEARSGTSSSSSPKRSSSVRRSSSSGGYSGASTARQPRTITVKNTKRDAAIGAGAGAVIGAVAAGSGNRVKGAVIGGVVGGVAGAVVGSTIDKSTRVVY